MFKLEQRMLEMPHPVLPQSRTVAFISGATSQEACSLKGLQDGGQVSAGNSPEVRSLPVCSALKDAFFKDIHPFSCTCLSYHPSVRPPVRPSIHPSTKYLLGVYYVLGTQSSETISLFSEILFIYISSGPGRTIKVQIIATIQKSTDAFPRD